MESPTFPEARFVAAGATPDELAAMQRLFSTSDVGLQNSLVAQWAELSASGLIEYIETMRADNFFATIASDVQNADTFTTTSEPVKTVDSNPVENPSESENDHEGAEANDSSLD
jgi:hypothetical protein